MPRALHVVSVADVDYLIANTTIEHANIMQHPVILVGNDTDLLVMLIHCSHTDNVYMQYGRDFVYNIHSIKQVMNPSVSEHILYQVVILSQLSMV